MASSIGLRFVVHGVHALLGIRGVVSRWAGPFCARRYRHAGVGILRSTIAGPHPQLSVLRRAADGALVSTRGYSCVGSLAGRAISESAQASESTSLCQK
jgi:hypothetical protein